MGLLYLFHLFKIQFLPFKFLLITSHLVGRDSSVDIGTDYGMDSPGSNPVADEIFRTCPDRPWGSYSLLYNGYWVLLGGKERPGRDSHPSSRSSAVVMKG